MSYNRPANFSHLQRSIKQPKSKSQSMVLEKSSPAPKTKPPMPNIKLIEYNENRRIKKWIDENIVIRKIKKRENLSKDIK